MMLNHHTHSHLHGPSHPSHPSRQSHSSHLPPHPAHTPSHSSSHPLSHSHHGHSHLHQQHSLSQHPQHSLSAENVSWSSPSGSPSPPPPPPLPPHTSARWAQRSQTATPAPGDACHQCRGRYASLNSRMSSVNSYTTQTTGCNKDQPPYLVYPTVLPNNDRCGTPLSTPATVPVPDDLSPHLVDGDDDSTCPVLLAGELRALHRNVPALRRRDVDTAAIRQHHYPEGGWGWIVCGAAFLAHLLTSGLQLAFGLLYLYTMQHLVPRNVDREAYAMGTGKMCALKSTAVKDDIIKQITNKLKCEECTNYLYPPVKFYDEQVICGRCAEEYDADYLKSNKYITAIGELLEFPCVYEQHGCKELTTWKEAKRHEDACPFRRYKCPSLSANQECSWEGSLNELRPHFETHVEWDDDSDIIEVDFENKSLNYLVEKHGELFVFQTKCDTSSDLLFYEVRFIGPPQQAPRFYFKVELFIKYEDRKYTERKQVETDETWKLDGAQSLCVRIGMVKAMLMNSEDIWLKLEISVRVPLYNGQADQALMHEVECPVCKDHMIRPIRMCETGHSICNNCYHKLVECPTCRAKFSNTRNISLETLSEQLHYRCMYYEEGCNFTGMPDKIKDHEMVCEVGYYDCPLKQFANCKYRGRIGQVCIHASKEHQFDIVH